MKKLLAALLMTAILVTLITGCVPKDPTASPSPSANPSAPVSGSPEPADSQPTELRYGVTTDPSSLDPFVNIGADSIGLFYNVFEGLVKIGADGDYHPALAESWSASDDYTVYTFKLRSGVKFHNGAEFSAQDVIATYTIAIEEYETKGFTSITDMTADGDVLTITLSEPNNDFLTILNKPIIPAGYEDSATVPVGTGPYKFESYSPQSSLVFVKFEEYWGEKANIDKLSIIIHADYNAIQLSLQSGNIDGAFIDASFLGSVDTDKYNIIQRNSNAPQLLALNNAVAPFDNVLVRQALNYAIDRDEIITIVGQGYGEKIGSALIPGISTYYNAELAEAYPVDLDKARSLLEQAGYSNLSFTIRAPSNYPVHVQTAQVIASQLEKIGVTVTIEQIDWATWVDDVYRNHNYEATIISLAAESVSPKAELLRYHSATKNNFISFKSDTYDDVYTRAADAPDGQEKIDLFKQAQKILSDEAASVFIQDIAGLSVLSKEYTGLTSFPVYGVIDFAAIKKVG